MTTPTVYKALGLALAGVAVVAGIAWGISRIFDAGVEKGRLEGRNELQAAVIVSEKSRSESLERLLAAQGEIARIEREAADREAAALARGRTQAKTVERVIRENPEFAATVRPADLRSVRDEQLADVAAAANRSAELSAASLRGVRTPGAP